MTFFGLSKALAWTLRHLILEITERVLLEESVHVHHTIEQLSRKGVAFALDDFGCGYSNLAQLRLHPVSTLKIDRSLLRGFEEDEKAQIIYENIVRLARKLGLRTVSEGVETDVQLKFLAEIGCDFAQGYLMGRPVPAGELKARLGVQI